MAPTPSTGSCKAFGVYEAGGEFKPVDLTLPDLGEYDVEVKITHCGVCHSDIHTIDGDWNNAVWPMVTGHEIVGHISALGPKVTDLKIGQRVGVGPQGGTFCFPDLCNACVDKRENYCDKGMIKTFNTKKNDGYVTMGGYSQYHRCESRFAIPIPDVMPSDVAAPLLCAGVTTYTPLKYANVKKGTRVAVVGIGGLGHMAVKLAAAMGAEVTAISTSPNKEAAARAWGATGFLVSKDDDAMEKAKRSFDLLVCTVSVDLDWEKYLSLLAPLGRLHLLGVPPGQFKSGLGTIIRDGITVMGSLIGSAEEQKEMLALCAEHNVYPEIEKVTWDNVNAAIKKVRDNTVRYRMVLEIAPQE